MKKIDRFLQYLKYKGITENRATVECGLSQGLLHQAKTGRADLGRKTIEKILITYQDLNNVWLLTGEGEMLNAEINNDGIINGNVFSGKGNQNINVALPDIGKQITNEHICKQHTTYNLFHLLDIPTQKTEVS